MNTLNQETMEYIQEIIREEYGIQVLEADCIRIIQHANYYELELDFPITCEIFEDIVLCKEKYQWD